MGKSPEGQGLRRALDALALLTAKAQDHAPSLGEGYDPLAKVAPHRKVGAVWASPAGVRG